LTNIIVELEMIPTNMEDEIQHIRERF
jgi:hypothetical protein